MRNAYRILIGKSEGENPLGRFIRWWEESIKMDFQRLGSSMGRSRYSSGLRRVLSSLARNPGLWVLIPLRA
jgi:hypothetical protein